MNVSPSQLVFMIGEQAVEIAMLRQKLMELERKHQQPAPVDNVIPMSTQADTAV